MLFNLLNSLPLSTALRKSIVKYNFNCFKNDLLAAFIVSLIALPLSMALSVAVGLPPENGIYTAIVAGIMVPLLGGSIWQVSGPTAAFVVILAPIVTELGLRGIIWAGFLSGLLLFIMGIFRLGKLINYIPHPVTTGFTAGIAVVLGTISLNDFLGLGIAKLSGSYLDKLGLIIKMLPNFDPYSLIIGITTLILMLFGARIIKFLPSSIPAMLVAILLAILFKYLGHDVATIGSKFSYIDHGGQVIAGVPPYLPIFHFPNFVKGDLFKIPSLAEFKTLLFPAFAIAILAALESLLSATVADSMAGTRHNPNAELNALGLANILSSFAGGIPATGAIARTATNINAGAKTPLASAFHAVFIMLYVVVLTPYINYIPMASLAALLIHTAYRMSHYKQFFHIIQLGYKNKIIRSDVVVLLISFLLTVFVDMVYGVSVGIVCSSLLLIKMVAENTDIEVFSHEKSPNITKIVGEVAKDTMIYQIHGPLFFGTVGKAFERYNFTQDNIHNFVFDVTDVPFIDMSGLVAFKEMILSIYKAKRNIVIICNVERVKEKILAEIDDEEIVKHIKFCRTSNECSVP